MTSNFAALRTWVSPLIEQLSPGQRSSLLRQLRAELRSRIQQRTAAQQDYQGAAFERRRYGNKPMFRRAASLLQTESDASQIRLGWSGRTARIMRVHQFGGTDRIHPDRPRVARYSRRAILGFSDEEIRFIEQFLLAHLQA